MALDLSLLGRTGVQAVAALMNLSLDTNIDPNWITCVGAGAPFAPQTSVTVSAIATPDASGNAAPYTGSQVITYNRAGFSVAFRGLNLSLRKQLPFTVGDAVAALQKQYGILIEQADIQNSFSDNVQLDGFGNLILRPALNSLRFYVDYSPFMIKIFINQSTLTDLQKLIATTQQADMAALNAANTPAPREQVPVPQPPDALP